MKIRYKVVGVHEGDTQAEATLSNGNKVMATIPCYVVETVSDCETMGHTFRTLEKPEFKEGDIVEAVFSVVEPALDLTDTQEIGEGDVGKLDPAKLTA